MDETGQIQSEQPPFDPEFDDRLSALELRNAAHDRPERIAAGRDQIAIVLALAGTMLAVATVMLGSPLFGVVSLSAALVVYGLGSRSLAAVNGVAAIAGLLIAVVFVPALHEIDHRTQQAINGLVLTATSSQPVFDTGPAYGELDGPFVLPTYGPVDIDVDE